MRCLLVVLRPEGDELLHGDVRSVARARRAGAADLVSRARVAHRATQVTHLGSADQTVREVITPKQFIRSG